MKKVVAIVLTAILTVSLLAGCGGTKLKAYNYDMSKYVQLGQYKGIEIDKNSDTFKNYMESYFKNDVSQNKLFNKRTEGTVADGDIVNISYKGTKVSDGTVFTGASSNTEDGYEDFDLTIGSGHFIDGFESQLVGAEVGKEKEIIVTFPENYGNEDLNGQPAKFNVKIKYINVYPEKNDDFAKKLKFDNIEAYNQDLEGKTIRAIISEKIFNSDKFVIKSYPPAEKANYDKLYETFVANAQQQAQSYNSQNGTSITSDDVLYQVYGMTADNLKNYYQNNLKQESILYAIFDKENLSYTEEQYDETISDLATKQGVTSQEIKEGMEEWAIESTVVSDIVFDFMKNSARIK